jgi:hypothetical protein
VTAVNSDGFVVQPAGMREMVKVDFTSVKRCRGAGVLVPGALKSDQRCRDKIVTDYEGKEEWPPASSLFDIMRCCVVLDDPYSMAVLVAYLQKKFDVVRIKNRFEHDEVEEVSAEQIQAEFYGAETQGEDTQSNSTIHTGSSSETHSAKMYRDVLLNLRARDSDFIGEVQITLTGIAILKKSEQKIYSIMRMASSQELLETFVFSRRANSQSGSETMDTPVLQECEVPFRQSSLVSAQSTVETCAVEPLSPQSPEEKRTGWAGVIPVSPKIRGGAEAAWASFSLSPKPTKRYVADPTEDELEPLSPLSVKSVHSVKAGARARNAVPGREYYDV